MTSANIIITKGTDKVLLFQRDKAEPYNEVSWLTFLMERVKDRFKDTHFTPETVASALIIEDNLSGDYPVPIIVPTRKLMPTADYFYIVKILDGKKYSIKSFEAKIDLDTCELLELTPLDWKKEF